MAAIEPGTDRAPEQRREEDETAGGRAAEEVVFADVSTGASDDLERATAIARQMVCRFGMSEELGARTYGVAMESPYLAGRELEERNYSDEAARRIDSAVRALIEQEHERAREILEARRVSLETVAARLLAVETIERAELETLARPASPAAA